jgi:hypothetical protein
MINKFKKKVTKYLKECEVKILHKWANNLGFDFVKKKSYVQDLVIENFFKTNFSKHALISYVVNPFIEPISNRHTNQQECFAIAEVLNSLSFNVDIIDGNNISFVPTKKYELVLDNHSTLERLHAYLDPKCVKILHITHAHLLYQNYVEYQRLLDLQARRGISLKPIRSYHPSNSIVYCDFATCLGAQFTADTYLFAKKEIFYLPMSSNFNSDTTIVKDISKYKSNYLWFGNTGAILKGLDLILEVFASTPNAYLTVCFPLESEPDFVEAYSHELFELPNIKTVGWIDVSTVEFINLLKEHLFVISASASEGGGGSIITCMKGGLIPIVSYQTSIDIQDFGFKIDNCSIESIRSTISDTFYVGIFELEQMSTKVFEFANSIHNLQNFKNTFKNLIEQKV